MYLALDRTQHPLPYKRLQLLALSEFGATFSIMDFHIHPDISVLVSHFFWRQGLSNYIVRMKRRDGKRVSPPQEMQKLTIIKPLGTLRRF